MADFEKLPVASWKVGGKAAIKFPVERVSEAGGQRLVERERPYRPGAKVDTTGPKAKRWTLTLLLENTIEEPGLSNSGSLYPDVVNALIASFDVQETGDLVLPTRGKVRCKAESYTRDEAAELRDAATLSLVFVEDNEDRVTAQSFTAPQATSSSRRLSETTTFSAQSDGMWDTSIGDLQEAASELEGIANLPGETLSDVDQQAGQVVAATNRVGRAFTQESPGRDTLRDPESSQTQRKLQNTKDIAARARARAKNGQSELATLVHDVDRTLFDIATDLGQAASDLISINPNLDPLHVPAKTPVKVFA